MSRLLSLCPQLPLRAALLAAIACALALLVQALPAPAAPARDVTSRSFDLGGGYTLTVHLLLVSGLDAAGEKAAADAFFAEHYAGLPTVAGYAVTPDSWPASAQPVTIAYNQNMADRPSLKDAGDFAVQVWNSTPGNALRLASGGATSATVGTCLNPFVRDGQNTVSYGATGGLVLGLTCPVSNAEHQVVEADVMFSNTVQFSSAAQTPASAFDLWSVAVHEFGHFAGLDHPCQSNVCGSDAVMEPQLTQGQQRRTPRPDDVSGLNSKYPATRAAGPFRAFAPVLAGDNPR